MDTLGNWTVSPAYDLSFSSGPGGEHATTVMDEGENPTQEHLLKLANLGNVKRDKGLDIIHQVLAATEKWQEFAASAGVSKLQTKNIGEILLSIRKKF